VTAWDMTQIAVALGAILGLGSRKSVGVVDYEKWTVRGPVFQAVSEGAFENVAVKDPSIVYHDGKYHLFYTGKHVDQTKDGVKYSITTGYVAAPTLATLNSAKRYNLSELVGGSIIAPQVFYFAPHKLWYVVAHRYAPGMRPNLAPIFLTNPDIDNVYGWSKPKDLIADKGNEDFWIDFWVICDDKKAHLYYADQRGSVLRRECVMEDFPAGFADAEETVALTVFGEDDMGKWAVFEAPHVYHVKNPDTYFMILECGYYKEEREYFADARKRFIIGMVADRLEGPWTRVEHSQTEYFAHGENLFNDDGSKSRYDQISHPELIRSGYDQKLEVESFGVDMIFQSFDSSSWPDNYNYNELPWELAVMHNY